MVDQKQTAEVIVDGGYKPAVVTLKQGVPAQLAFKRINTAGCLDQIVIPDFGIKADLPLNETQTFTIDTTKPGDYVFTCGMGMVKGELVIR